MGCCSSKATMRRAGNCLCPDGEPSCWLKSRGSPGEELFFRLIDCGPSAERWPSPRPTCSGYERKESPMKSSRAFRRNDALPYQVLDGRVVIVDAKAGKVHLLNGTASRIWSLLDQAATVE